MMYESRTRVLLRRVALTLAALAVLVVLLARTTRVSQAGPPAESPGRTTVFLPLFLEGGGYRSVLTVNNNRPEAVQTEVEIFGPGGRSSQRLTLEIPPLTAVERPLGALLPGSVPFGSLELRYQGLPLEVTAQVTVSSVVRRVSFESVETHPAHSRRLDAILWLPHSGARATVALTNRSEGPLGAVLTEVGSGRSSVVRLQSRETRLIGATRFGREDRGGELTALLSVEHDGDPGDVAATGFVLDEQSGFSSTLVFVDWEAGHSSRLAASDFRFGPPDPAEGFPAGVSFRATLALANRGDSPQQATVFVNTTKDGLTDRVEVTRVDLAPRSVRTLPLRERLAELGIEGPVQEAGLDIAYDGEPGRLLARLSSLDPSGDYSFDHPVKDPEAGLRTGGSYPWRLDGGRRTVLRLKNTTGRTERAVLQLRHRGESYTPERIVLGPWESVSLDLAGLRESGEADLKGRVLPPDAESGQLVWYGESRGALIGRAEVRNDWLGVASSFSCEPVCCGVVREDTFMTPSSAEDPVGEEGYPFVAEETRRDCYGIIFGPYDMSEEAEWESTDSSVASVASAGLVSCNSGGTAGITASWESTVAYSHYPVICFAIVAGAVAGASMQVTEPTLSGPSTVTRGGNASFTIQNTITGSQISDWKFTSNLGTVTRTSGTSSTSWSGEMATSGTVTVTVVQGGNSYPLSMPITVTARQNFGVSAVSAQKVANGTSPELTVSNPPTSSSTQVGRFVITQMAPFTFRTIGSGPNKGFKYVLTVSNTGTNFQWVISPAAENASSEFFQMQCGNFDPQSQTGFISGAELKANTIHHESANLPNSHYYNYRVAQDDPENNVGVVAESLVAGPSTSAQTFSNNVSNTLGGKQTTIRIATQVEPCGGLVNRNHAGNCENLGAINYPPSYQACP